MEIVYLSIGVLIGIVIMGTVSLFSKMYKDKKRRYLRGEGG